MCARCRLHPGTACVLILPLISGLVYVRAIALTPDPVRALVISVILSTVYARACVIAVISTALCALFLLGSIIGRESGTNCSYK